MEAKLVVHIDGHARQITGSVEDSSVSEVITALAQANNKIGRFSLVLLNKSNNIEYFLRSNDIPYRVLELMKEKGIDCQLEVRDVDQIADISQELLPRRPSSETISIKTDPIEPQTQKSPDFEQILNGMNKSELEELIQNQDDILWKHQIKIVGLESEVLDEKDQELLQLLKQRNNLRQTLNELTSIDWKQCKLDEFRELKNVALTVESFKLKIANKQSQLDGIQRESEKLKKEISKLQRHNY